LWLLAEVAICAAADLAELTGAHVLEGELPVGMADEIVRDPEKLEESGIHSQMVGLLAELLEMAQPGVAAAA
jgi:hypothetical protein